MPRVVLRAYGLYGGLTRRVHKHSQVCWREKDTLRQENGFGERVPTHCPSVDHTWHHHVTPFAATRFGLSDKNQGVFCVHALGPAAWEGARVRSHPTSMHSLGFKNAFPSFTIICNNAQRAFYGNPQNQSVRPFGHFDPVSK